MAGFKTYTRGARNMAVEESFAMGMRYTDTPQAEGYCKALINFDLKDAGAVLIPRPGYQQLHVASLGASTAPVKIHHTAQGTVYNTVTQQDASKRYILCGPDEASVDWLDFSKCRVLIEQAFSSDFDSSAMKNFLTLEPVLRNNGLTGEAFVQDVFRIRRTPRTRTQLLHNISLVPASLFQGMPYLPSSAMLNNVAVLPVQYDPHDGAVKNGLAKLKLTTSDGSVLEAKLDFVEPQQLTPTEAINYGYNMLAPSPYSFADVISAAVPANYIIMEGILPYADEACTQIKFNARVGENITFRLFSKFPDATSAYRFRWEIREIGTENVSVYEDQQVTDKLYKYFAGADNCAKNVTPATDVPYVKLTFQPPYRQFSITVIAFSDSDLTEPLQVMTLASYTLSDGAALTNNAEVRSYPLSTATDLCTWKQRVVLWGVTGADNMIFVSDVNNPAYFPYPNNVDIFEDKVVACVPYLGDLLVFTESKLYRLRWSGDGLSFKTDMIQDKLYMSAFDKETITVVQNMVFFKNGNYFFMVVPRTSSAEPGALQLAPISTPITNFLDRFQESVKELIFRLYNPTDGSLFPYLSILGERDIEIYDYYNYLDNAVIRNVYKFKMIDRNRTTGEVTRTLLFFDFILNYDTLSRAWTSYVVQTDIGRMWPYRQNVTDATVFVNVTNQPTFLIEEDELGNPISSTPGFIVNSTFIKPNVLSAQDSCPLAFDVLVPSRVLKNHQYIDTGYREHNTQTKKRYREIQFKVNNISQQTLQFGTEFLVDDTLRKSLFRYETRHVTDLAAQDYGYFYVERVFDDPSLVSGATTLDDEDSPEVPYLPGEHTVPSGDLVLQSNRWTLDVSQLSNVAVVKVRMKVSGKGYSPRLILVSFNDELYELLNHNWVYRAMNAR